MTSAIRHPVLPLVVTSVGVLGVLVAAPNNYVLNVGVLIAVHAISALGLTVVAGRTGQFSLGQAGFMAVSGYFVAFSMTAWTLPFLVALAGGVAIALVAGLVIGYIALRLEGHYLAMATLAFGAIVHGLVRVDGPLGGANGLYGIPAYDLFGDTIASQVENYVLSWTAVIIAFAGCLLFLKGRVGLELRALKDDELAASMLGVNIIRRKLEAFALSGILGGLAGGLLPPALSVIDPSLFAPTVSFQILLTVVIGGLGSLGGAVAGSAVVVLLFQFVPGSGDFALLALGAVVIARMTVLHGGLADTVTWALSRARRGSTTRRPGPIAGDA